MEITTKGPLKKPIEITIDGKIYHVRRISRPVAIEISAYEKEMRGGNLEAVYKQLALYIDAPQETIDAIDITDLRAIQKYITDRVYERITGTEPDATPEEKTKAAAELEEKNLPKPGETPSVG